MSVFLLSATNILTKAEINRGELQLTFKDPYDKREIRYFKLSKPHRHVFDFKNMHISKNIQNKKFESLRIAQYQKNIVRVVIDGTAYICNSYSPLFDPKKYNITLPKNTIVPSFNHKKIAIKTANKRDLDYSHRNQPIVIDAGHGGHDPGARGGRRKEKDVVLQIARRLSKQLKKRGFPVYMTRDRDQYLRLSERTKIADKKNAAVFISIHVNAVPKRKANRVHGIETYFLQNTRDAKSQRIAARENREVLKGAGSRLSKQVIVDSVLSGPKVVESNKLAISVHSSMMANLRSKYKGVKDGGVRHAPFYVLVGASRPSILVEAGYISHYRERKRLFMPRYQELIAKGIAEGVDSYLYHRKKEIDF